ncbi:thioesterase-like superfamily domain-containing [Trichoderma arundinaceum]|uniref:Thioesterase-like superfamily domain-containing n=1 Tax=Trichoderma arundinaceum TaxID=490622 RepID=A0A395NWH7_TRIAR|nr:thioesterase-like superfamily domain-containing [Trichoderma arundinaceum]
MLDSIEQHPLFQPVLISTYVPLLEIDMNLHKSNSTFFTDLDVSRIKLMGRIIAPAWPMDDMEIEYKGRDGKDKKEKVKGRPALILGATHTSFKRELRPYATYDIESRILGWDSRWIYVGSWFLSKTMPKKKIYATSLSKYIIKKGRITVPPEQFFRECGWIPIRNENNNKKEEMAGNEKFWSWSEVEAHKEKGMQIIQTWGEANVLMEQEYEG